MTLFNPEVKFCSIVPLKGKMKPETIKIDEVEYVRPNVQEGKLPVPQGKGLDYDDIALEILIPYMNYVNDPEYQDMKPFGRPNIIIKLGAKLLAERFGKRAGELEGHEIC